MNKTKRRIFNTAIKLFSEKGYDNTNIEEITAIAGVAKGSLYYHFSKKEDIFDLLLEEGEKLLKNNIEIKTKNCTTALEKIKAVIMVQIKVTVKYEHFINIKSSKNLTGIHKASKNIFPLNYDQVHECYLEGHVTTADVVGNLYSISNKVDEESLVIIILSSHGEYKDGEYYFIPGRTDYIGKGLDILLSAYSVFRERHPEIKLVLVGPEGEGHYLLTRALEKKCNKDSVFYLGRVNDDTLVSLYSHCASTIISSRFEGFGFPVLEAMQYGVPIICSDAGALKEIAGEAALIFESGNVNQLVNQMETIYSASKGYISDLKRKGAYRLKSFSWNKCAQEMYEEFSALTVGALSSDNIS